MNKIYNLDCLDLMGKMSDGFIDLVITSPPYDNLRKYEGFSFSYEETLKGLYRVIKDGGVVVWVVADQTINGSETGNSFRQALCAIEIGFNLHDTMIFLKNNYIPSNYNGKRYSQSFDYMFIFSKGVPNTFNFLRNNYKSFKKRGTIVGRRDDEHTHVFKRIKKNMCSQECVYSMRGNSWSYNVGGSHGTSHRATFPVDLCKDHILTWTNQGDIVYDPFSGSGTTCLSCEILQRKYIGSEVSELYYKESVERLRKNRSLFSV